MTLGINPQDLDRKEIKRKVKQALQVSDYDLKLASVELVELCLRDHAFLLGLTEPFLRGIIGHTLKSAMKTREISQDDDCDMIDDSPKKLDVESMGKATGLGADIVKTVLGEGGHQFGTKDRTRSTLGKKTKASDGHIDALKQIAESQRSKKD